MDAWIRQNAESAYHPSCTCKIGGEGDPLAVLDPDCRVRGVEALRVVDSSIFPTITNGNLNAPTIMVAEKAADIILGKEPLPASNAPYYLDEDWETRQRTGEPARAVLTPAGRASARVGPRLHCRLDRSEIEICRAEVTEPAQVSCVEDEAGVAGCHP
jgi:choline dehydrogenase